MANHVTTRIMISCNEEVNLLLSQWKERVCAAETIQPYVTILRDDYDPEVGADYQWYMENIGAKWCFIEEVCDFSQQINLVSAWDWPHYFCEWLYDRLAEIDPDVELRVEYEDEMPNFIGTHHYSKNGDRGLTISYDEILELMELPDFEDEEEEWQYIQENIYETIGEWFQNNG